VPTDFFLTDTASPIDLGASTDEKKALLVRGSGLVVSTTNTLTGPIAEGGLPCLVSIGGNQLVWFTEPLNTVTISGLMTFNIWAAESNMSANAGIEVVAWRCDNSGALISTIIDSEKGTELPITTRATQNWTGTPTSTTLADGDRVKIKVAINDGGGTMASGFNVTMGYSAASSGVDGNTFVKFNETVTEQGAVEAISPRVVNAPSLASTQASRW
jgi:hypothetical protein